jgi:dienelactone hydrolase
MRSGWLVVASTHTLTFLLPFAGVHSRMLTWHSILSISLVLCVVVQVTDADDESPAATPGVWPIERLKSEVPTFRIEDQAAKMQSLIYDGETIHGEVTEVFAFYASPKTIGSSNNDTRFPGIVLIHGGGGTAYADWVWMWANRGYAAIAMDLGGRRPPAPEYDSTGNLKPHTAHKQEARTRLAKGGVTDDHTHKFDSIGETIDDDWPFHAVANVMRAHTLIRSFPEVDEDRTAVTGISWGGYTTCLTASHDDRFKAAVPVYGCGFLHEGESVQKPAIDMLGDRRAAWVAAYDPGSHLGKCTVPTLWVNGTHDVHYVLDSYAKSYAIVQGPRAIRIEPHMPHGHTAGWQPAEIPIFIDSILRGKPPLAKVGAMKVRDDGSVTVPFESVSDIVKAELHFTADSGLRSKRKWESIECRLSNGTAIANGLPPEANTWIITLTDSRNAMISSEVGFR